NWQGSEIWIQHAFAHLGRLRFGKQKESFVYEMVGDAANLPQQERFLSPFFVSRDFGLSLTNNYAGQQGTWSAGVYNDWWLEDEDFDTSGTDFSARVTYLPIWEGDGERYLHLGTAVRYYGPDDDLLRYRGRPESNVADYYVDTGDLDGDHAWH